MVLRDELVVVRVEDDEWCRTTVVVGNDAIPRNGNDPCTCLGKEHKSCMPTNVRGAGVLLRVKPRVI